MELTVQSAVKRRDVRIRKRQRFSAFLFICIRKCRLDEKNPTNVDWMSYVGPYRDQKDREAEEVDEK